VKRFAAIADIHGNRWALEAALRDIERRGIRQIVNLGDHLYGPLDLTGTADLLIRLDLPSIRGNQDREEMPVSETHRRWLDSLPFSLKLPGMLLFHGTPLADDVYLLETVHSGGVSMADSAQVEQRLGPEFSATDALPSLLLCGHSHIPRVTAFRHSLIVNPGSVGLQAYADDLPLPHVMETGSPHARYAFLEADERGWSVEHICVLYDFASAAEFAVRQGRPDWSHRLLTGRCA